MVENLRSTVRQAWISAPARGTPAPASSSGSGEKTPPLQACWRHEEPRRRHPGECPRHSRCSANNSVTLTRLGERAGSYCSLPTASWVSSPHPSYAKGRPSSGFQRAWGLPPTPPPAHPSALRTMSSKAGARRLPVVLTLIPSAPQQASFIPARAPRGSCS